MQTPPETPPAAAPTGRQWPPLDMGESGVISRVYECLRTSAPDGSMVARRGGDEFAVIMRVIGEDEGGRKRRQPEKLAPPPNGELRSYVKDASRPKRRSPSWRVWSWMVSVKACTLKSRRLRDSGGRRR